MPTVKQKPCCARVNARVTMERANLGRLAKTAAIRAEKGLDLTAINERIASARRSIAEAEAMVVDHDADHAGGRR